MIQTSDNTSSKTRIANTKCRTKNGSYQSQRNHRPRKKKSRAEGPSERTEEGLSEAGEEERGEGSTEETTGSTEETKEQKVRPYAGEGGAAVAGAQEQLKETEIYGREEQVTGEGEGETRQIPEERVRLPFQCRRPPFLQLNGEFRPGRIIHDVDPRVAAVAAEYDLLFVTKHILIITSKTGGSKKENKKRFAEIRREIAKLIADGVDIVWQPEEQGRHMARQEEEIDAEISGVAREARGLQLDRPTSPTPPSFFSGFIDIVSLGLEVAERMFENLVTQAAWQMNVTRVHGWVYGVDMVRDAIAREGFIAAVARLLDVPEGRLERAVEQASAGTRVVRSPSPLPSLPAATTAIPEFPGIPMGSNPTAQQLEMEDYIRLAWPAHHARGITALVDLYRDAGSAEEFQIQLQEWNE
ncbi:hypothetical protein HK104_008514 [Borealophlyctis nickersoniae]|nr:hypothetical protein HK104_008514 [Borealophlyctis nickersoniae]